MRNLNSCDIPVRQICAPTFVVTYRLAHGLLQRSSLVFHRYEPSLKVRHILEKVWARL